MKRLFIVYLAVDLLLVSCSSGSVTEADLEGRSFAYVLDTTTTPEQKGDSPIDPRVLSLLDDLDKLNRDKPITFHFEKDGKGQLSNVGQHAERQVPIDWSIKGDSLYINVYKTPYRRFQIVRSDGPEFIVREQERDGDTFRFKPL